MVVPALRFSSLQRQDLPAVAILTLRFIAFPSFEVESENGGIAADSPIVKFAAVRDDAIEIDAFPEIGL